MALLLAVVASAAASCSGPAEKNLIVLTLDTTRADFLGAYAATEPRRKDGIGTHTPFLDTIAKQGTRFDLAISSSAVTPVSHASIFTGRDNHEHGLRVLSAETGYRLPDSVPTLAEILERRGYHTVAIHSAFPVASVFGFARGFDVFESLETELPEAGGTWDVSTYQRRSDATTKLALDRLEKVSPPFYLWIHYWDPHDARKLPPAAFSETMARQLGGRARSAQAFRRDRRLRYATEVAYMDSQIGELMKGLEARGLLEDSIVVVVADHGQGLGDHGWFHHRILYQEQIRVPLIISVPGQEQQPTVPDLVRTKDILPTVLEYLDVPVPDQVSGSSLRPLMEGRPDTERIAFADQINGFDLNARMVADRPLDDFVYVAMDRNWKLVYRPNHPEKSDLYHLAKDPREAHNVYDRSHPEAIRLLEALAARAPWVTEPFDSGTGPRTTDEMRSALEALGYIESGSELTEIVTPAWRWTCPADAAIVRDTVSDQDGCGTPLVPFVPLPTSALAAP